MGGQSLFGSPMAKPRMHSRYTRDASPPLPSRRRPPPLLRAHGLLPPTRRPPAPPPSPAFAPLSAPPSPPQPVRRRCGQGRGGGWSARRRPPAPARRGHSLAVAVAGAALPDVRAGGRAGGGAGAGAATVDCAAALSAWVATPTDWGWCWWRRRWRRRNTTKAPRGGRRSCRPPPWWWWRCPTARVLAAATDRNRCGGSYALTKTPAGETSKRCIPSVWTAAARRAAAQSTAWATADRAPCGRSPTRWPPRAWHPKHPLEADLRWLLAPAGRGAHLSVGKGRPGTGGGG